jgi:hypothetical protein
MTVTVMVPVKTLLAAASPLPAAVLLLLAFNSVSNLPGRLRFGPSDALMLPVLATLLFDLVAAEVFSVIVTVIVSPT